MCLSIHQTPALPLATLNSDRSLLTSMWIQGEKKEGPKCRVDPSHVTGVPPNPDEMSGRKSYPLSNQANSPWRLHYPMNPLPP